MTTGEMVAAVVQHVYDYLTNFTKAELAFLQRIEYKNPKDLTAPELHALHKMFARIKGRIK